MADKRRGAPVTLNAQGKLIKIRQKQMTGFWYGSGTMSEDVPECSTILGMKVYVEPRWQTEPWVNSSVAPNWIHQNHCLNICETGPCSKPASALLFCLYQQKNQPQGFGTVAVTVDAGKGPVCREGCLLSGFVKCKTWNRSPHFRP